VFGGGVGEHAAAVRAAIVADMGWAGIELDAEANRTTVGVEARIDAATSRVQLWVIPVDEAAILAEAAQALLGGP
jgi:acetate kinase